MSRNKPAIDKGSSVSMASIGITVNTNNEEM